VTIAVRGIGTGSEFRARSSLKCVGARQGPGEADDDDHHLHGPERIFTDQNGPKGGMAIRCAVTAAVPRQATVRIAPLAATAPLAFAKAMKALERSLSGVPDQRRALSRRPKKYYLAKRMLESS
jgi:hypothetical protein